MGGLISGLFGGGKVDTPPPIKQIEYVKTPTKDSAAEAADADIKKRRQQAAASGKGGTILTGLGASDNLDGTPVRKNILGGS